MVLKEFDILEQSASEPKFSQKQSVVIPPPLDRIKPSLRSGNELLVYGFGKSCVKGNEGRNPATGKDAILPAGRGETLNRCGKLCEKVNQRR